jgi:SpoVK/Ycf46/Vps4 family AAA+-type ATPase
MDINVLLQLIERYEGVTILTTNLKKSIDPAFERRFAFKVNFPMPEPIERERIWRHLLPEHVPTAEEIDYKRLSKNRAGRRGHQKRHHAGRLRLVPCRGPARHRAPGRVRPQGGRGNGAIGARRRLTD